MKVLYKVFALGLLWLLPCGLRAGLPQKLSDLLSSDKETKNRALAQMIAERDVTTFPILEAINQKKLYAYQGYLVTLGIQEEISGEAVFQLLDLYPKREVLRDASGVPVQKPLSALQSISFSRKDRLALVPMLPYINLSSIATETRKLAYTQFQNAPKPEDLAMVQQAALGETDEDMIRYAQETLLTIKLYRAQTAREQLALATKLQENLGDNSVQILQKFVETAQLSDQTKIAIQKQIGSLQSRAKRIGWIQNLFSGLSLGSILILIALGLAIIYGLAGVINMAHGEFMMIGAYTTYCLQEALLSLDPAHTLGDLFFWISLPVSFMVAGAFGLLVERFIIRKLYGKPLQGLLATWGVSLVLVQLARTVFGDLTAVRAPEVLSGGWQVVPQLVLPYNRLFVIGVTAAMISLVVFFLYRTPYGLRIRAVTQNRSMSACLGISTKRIDALTFFVGSGIAGVAGCCMTLIGNIVPDMGQTYIVDSFLVVVTGGVGNLAGTVVSGLGIGFLTKLLEPTFQAVFGKVIILGLIIFFIQFKPQGMFPAKGRIAEDTDL